MQGLFDPEDCNKLYLNFSPEYLSLCSHVALLYYLETNASFHIFYLNVIFYTLFPFNNKDVSSP
jgi:hypothetical protein